MASDRVAAAGGRVAAITRDQFEREYAERSGLTVEKLRELGRVVVACSCGAPECQGWASVSRKNAKDYEPGGIYGPRN